MKIKLSLSIGTLERTVKTTESLGSESEDIVVVVGDTNKVVLFSGASTLIKVLNVICKGLILARFIGVT
ncbi:hypothetical protein PAMA111031_07735 [Paraphotobacterium marinum]